MLPISQLIMLITYKNQGALGAWNLLVLCKYHHDALGDALSRERVRSALQQAMPARRHFPTDTDAKNTKSLRGLIADVKLDVEPFQASLFFSDIHAEIWLSPPDRVQMQRSVPETSAGDPSSMNVGDQAGSPPDSEQPDEPQESGVSFLITQAQKRALLERGYADEGIRNMAPVEAHKLLGLSSSQSS